MRSVDIMRLKERVRDRDDRSCVDCRKTEAESLQEFGATVHVHRLVPGSVYSEDGCVTVCQACHFRRHGSKARIKSPGNIVGKTIRTIRIRLGMTLTEFANMVGVSQNAVSRWELGDRRPRRMAADKIIAIGKQMANRKALPG